MVLNDPVVAETESADAILVAPDHVQDYLDRHFVSLPWLARATGVSDETVLELIASRCAPGPSYEVLHDGIVKTDVFGVLPSRARREGAYYPPACAGWIRYAVAARTDASGELCRVAGFVHQRFREAYVEALHLLQSEVSGINALELADDVDETIEHWLAGTFGICTRQPRSAHAIARKQLAQRRLSRLTDNGGRRAYAAHQAVQVLEAMAEYDAAAMPFSPADYPQSSRKRLVDDLFDVVRAACGA